MTPNAQVEKMKNMSSGATAWMLGATVHPGDEATDADIEILSSLHSAAMAHALGLSPRAFRDRVEFPRNEDGTFNARDVMKSLPHDSDNPMLRLVRDGHYGAVVGWDVLTRVPIGLMVALEGLPPRPTKARVIEAVRDFLIVFFEIAGERSDQ